MSYIHKNDPEIVELQKNLEKGLQKMLTEVGDKLSPAEKKTVQQEVESIKELLERLNSGFVWIALFGRTAVGKSSIANALIGADVAQVGVEHDTTEGIFPYQKGAWMIVDVPGFMGKAVNEQLARDEAQKAHGHIFVIEEEPFQDEIELFDYVKSCMPDAPRIVFVNKADKFKHMPKKDREIVLERIKSKMKKYVKSEDDILFGSAMLYDSEKDEYVRQHLTVLEEKLYADAGKLGQIMNVLDPAKRAKDASDKLQTKVLQIRRQVARRIIQSFAIGEIATSLVPFGELLVTPGLLGTMTYSLIKVMQGNDDMQNIDKTKVTTDVLKVCAQFLAAYFIGATVVGILADVLGLGIFGVLVDLAGLSYFKYKRTVIFGEAMLLYIENNFSFGAHPKGMIQKAKEQAELHYKNHKLVS